MGDQARLEYLVVMRTPILRQPAISFPTLRTRIAIILAARRFPTLEEQILYLQIRLDLIGSPPRSMRGVQRATLRTLAHLFLRAISSTLEVACGADSSINNTVAMEPPCTEPR